MSSFPSQLRSAKRQRPPICALPQTQNMPARDDSVNCITPEGIVSCKINYFLQNCEDGSNVARWHYAMHATDDVVPCLCVSVFVFVCFVWSVVCVVCALCGFGVISVCWHGRSVCSVCCV